VFCQHGLFTAIHKYYTLDDWFEFEKEHPTCMSNVAVSSGISEADFERLQSILHKIPSIKFICLDVANGYTQVFVEYVRKVRKEYPNHTIIVST